MAKRKEGTPEKLLDDMNQPNGEVFATRGEVLGIKEDIRDLKTAVVRITDTISLLGRPNTENLARMAGLIITIIGGFVSIISYFFGQTISNIKEEQRVVAKAVSEQREGHDLYRTEQYKEWLADARLQGKYEERIDAHIREYNREKDIFQANQRRLDDKVDQRIQWVDDRAAKRSGDVDAKVQVEMRILQDIAKETIKALDAQLQMEIHHVKELSKVDHDHVAELLTKMYNLLEQADKFIYAMTDDQRSELQDFRQRIAALEERGRALERPVFKNGDK